MIANKKFLLFAGFFTVVAVLLLVTGASLIEGPATMKLKKTDQRRVKDLGAIDTAIVSYFDRQGQLPKSLKGLEVSTSRRLSLLDPETGIPYEYKVTTNKTFELCAAFNLSNQGTEHRYWYGGKDLLHDSGTNCFHMEITVDKDKHNSIQMN